MRRENLEARVVECVFLGYPKGVKGHKLYDPKNSKCVIRMYVVLKTHNIYMKNKPIGGLNEVKLVCMSTHTNFVVQHDSQGIE